jgi:hypothetical protein
MIGIVQDEHGRREHEDHERRMVDALVAQRSRDHAGEIADHHARISNLRRGPARADPQRNLFAHASVEGGEHQDQHEQCPHRYQSVAERASYAHHFSPFDTWTLAPRQLSFPRGPLARHR